MKFLRKHPVLSTLFFLFVALVVWTLWGNTALMTTEYLVESPRLPTAFDGFRIVQVSDLHNTEFGDGNRKLLKRLEKAQPDMIAITGDLLDSWHTDLEKAVAFAREAVKIAPTYYVPGNHESRKPEEYAVMKAEMEACGVIILENKSITLAREDASVTVTGLMDPDFGIPWPDLTSENYQVVLSHRPEKLDAYAAQSFDLVMTGHAHGGQFRLPFIGGLFAPHQGILPKYTSGVHSQGNTAMVISRGLGNSAFPLRFNNRPELVLIILESI